MSITGTKTEATYRAIQMDSSSSLKEFSLDRRKYYKKYFLNERIEEEDSKASITGRVVETLLLEPQEFDNRFHLSSCASVPTGLMLAFVEALVKYTLAATDENGTVNREFYDICKDAYIESGFKISLEAVLKKFAGTDNEIYYSELRQVKSRGLTVVTTDDVINAEKIVEELKTSPITSEIVNLVDSERYTVFNQLQIEGYSLNGHLFKSMMDRLIIDNKKKTIQVYDLKCTWSVENFYEEYYLYRRAYIQAYLYFIACKEVVTKSYSGYFIEYPKFIVCDSINYYSPLIYCLSEEDMKNAYYGFEYKGRTYPGVSQLIEDLNWTIENNIWNISRENYVLNGLVPLKK